MTVVARGSGAQGNLATAVAHARGSLALAAVMTIVFVISAGVRSDQANLLLRLYVLFLGLVGLRLITSLLGEILEPADRLRLELFLQAEPKSSRAIPADLEELERAVALASSSVPGLYLEIRPLLRRIAAQRLIAHHNVDLDTDPASAERLLGPKHWAALRVLSPLDRSAASIPPGELRQLIETLESL